MWKFHDYITKCMKYCSTVLHYKLVLSELLYHSESFSEMLQ